MDQKIKTVLSRSHTYYWIFFVVLFIRACYFVNRYAVDLFVNDQWSYLKNIIEPTGFFNGFLTTLGPHRLGLGYPIMSSVLNYSDFNNRAIAFLVLFLALINASLFTLLKLRISGKLKISDVAIPLVFFGHAQYAIFLNNPNITLHQLCFLLMFVVILMIRSKNGFATLSLFALIPLITFTGNGVVVIVALALISSVFALTSGKRINWRWVITSLLSITSLILYFKMAPEQAKDCHMAELESFLTPVYFIKGMVLNGLILNYSNSIISWIVFVGVMLLFYSQIVRLIRNSQKDPARLAPLLIAIYSICFILIAMLGRWCYPLEITSSSRYIPHASLLFLSMLLIIPGRSKLSGFYAFMFSVVLLYGEYKFHRYLEPVVVEWNDDLRSWKECYSKFNDLEYCNDSLNFSPFPWPEKINLQKKLEILEELNPTYQSRSEIDPN